MLFRRKSLDLNNSVFLYIAVRAINPDTRESRWQTAHQLASLFSLSERNPKQFWQRLTCDTLLGCNAFYLYGKLHFNCFILTLVRGFVNKLNSGVLNVMRHISLKVKQRVPNKCKQLSSNQQMTEYWQILNFKTDNFTGFHHQRTSKEEAKISFYLRENAFEIAFIKPIYVTTYAKCL